MKIDEMTAKSKFGQNLHWTPLEVQKPDFDLATISSIFNRFWIGQRIWTSNFMTNLKKIIVDLRLHKQIFLIFLKILAVSSPA
jgi:hypothetical protein